MAKDDKPEKGDDDKGNDSGAGSKDAVLADLAKERDKRQAAEAEAKKAREELDALKKDSDSSKTEIQKLTDRVEAAERKAADAEIGQLRAEIAQAKGLSSAQAKRLSGTTREELEADADDLVETFGIKAGEGDESGDNDKGDDEGDKPLGRPKEKLRPGAAPDSEPDKTGEQLADEVWKRTHGDGI